MDNNQQQYQQQYRQVDGYVNPQQYQQIDGYVNPQQYQQADGYVNPQQYQQADGYVNPQQYQQADGYVKPQQYQWGNGYVNPQQYQWENGYAGNETLHGLGKQRILNPSSIVSLIGAFLLILGITLPLVDFLHFHESVDIQYNLMKICKNVGLISEMWAGIPFGIVISIVGLIVLSFVNIPLLKLIPCIVTIIMIVLMLIDVDNVIIWVNNILDKYFTEEEILVNFEEIIKSLMYGVYFLISGIVLSLISCFLKGAE